MEEMATIEQPPLRCDGTVYDIQGGGTWKGHVWPGLIFVFWALWWAVQSFRAYLQGRADGSGYRSRAWWPGLYMLEPMLKIIGPPFGILIELRLDHTEFLCVLRLVFSECAPEFTMQVQAAMLELFLQSEVLN
jgi:hypothetical protein